MRSSASAVEAGMSLDHPASPVAAGRDVPLSAQLLSPRARLMMVAVGFVGLDVSPASMPPALMTVHHWLDSWSGIELIERGMGG